MRYKHLRKNFQIQTNGLKFLIVNFLRSLKFTKNLFTPSIFEQETLNFNKTFLIYIFQDFGCLNFINIKKSKF